MKQLRRLGAKLRDLAADAVRAGLLPDALLLAGCGAWLHGLNLIYPPAAWISAGAMLITLAVLLARKP